MVFSPIINPTIKKTPQTAQSTTTTNQEQPPTTTQQQLASQDHPQPLPKIQ